MPVKLTPEQRKKIKQRQIQEEAENKDYISSYSSDVMSGLKQMFGPVFTATSAFKKLYNFLENRNYYDMGNLR